MNLDAAQALALELMRQHRLHDWTFTFDRAKRRFGCCYYELRRISLSAHLVQLNSEEHVRDTILHEIAHALAGRKAGHGQAWQAIAQMLGCSTFRCYGQEVVQPPPQFEGTCPGCQRKIRRFRRKRVACARCSPCFDPRFLFIWKRCANE